jgi:hypothetical protein
MDRPLRSRSSAEKGILPLGISIRKGLRAKEGTVKDSNMLKGVSGFIAPYRSSV